MLQEERSEQSESEAGKEKRKGNKKRVYPSLGELRKKLKEPGEDSESEQNIYEDEDLTEDEEGEIIELMEKHSLKVPEKQHPKMVTVKQGHRPTAPPPYCSQEEELLVAPPSVWKCGTLFELSFRLLDHWLIQFSWMVTNRDIMSSSTLK
ncbi:hypothetical protein NN561_009011 [Cricetulus griseus]